MGKNIKVIVNLLNKKSCFLAIHLLLTSLAFLNGQVAGSKIWYFGSNAGVSFNTNPPSALTDGKVVTDEGCASVSDANGNLLFYTDGQIVYNKNHAQMSNGSGLNGNSSSTQSAVAVADPSDNDKFYLFTVDAFAGSNGLCYSVIDMSLSGGLGQVTTKNVKLRSPVSEKITAVRKPNSNVVWIIARGWGNDSFLVYKLDNTGCSFYTSQRIGSIINGGTENTAGYLKANLQGTKIAYATYQGFVELFDFDSKTAGFSNSVKFSGLGYAYGVEFSRSGQLLYFGSSTTKKIWQADVTLSTPALIVASQTEITSISGNPAFALQMGPDGKIYAAIANKSYLSSIPNPETKGTGCGFVTNAINLAGKNAKAGLPNFLASDNFIIHCDFNYSIACPTRLVAFVDTVDYAFDSLRWFFGLSGKTYLGTSTSKNPTYTFPNRDTYTVKLIVYAKNIAADSVTKNLIIPRGVTRDTLTTKICSGDSILINTIYRSTPGLYSDTFTGSAGCDSLVFHNLVLLQVTRDTMNVSICENNTYDFAGKTITIQGKYYDTITNYLGCDSIIMLDLVVLKSTNYQFSDTFCKGRTYSFFSNQLQVPGQYEHVLINHAGCDSIVNLNLVEYGNRSTFHFDTFCATDTYDFYGQDIKTPGVYSKTFTDKNGCDSAVVLNLSMKICYAVPPCIIELPEAFSPDNNGINDIFKPSVSCNVTSYCLTIYNRWGAKLFESREPKLGWDGWYLNAVVPNGIYIYVMNIDALQGRDIERHHYKGIVSVIR